MDVEIKHMPALRLATVSHVGPYKRISHDDPKSSRWQAFGQARRPCRAMFAGIEQRLESKHPNPRVQNGNVVVSYERA